MTPGTLSLSRAVLIPMLVATLTAAAAPPDQAPDVLHREAVTAFRNKRLAQAFALWTKAESLRVDWRFPFNLAVLHASRSEFLTAWDALDRADAIGIPPRHQALAAEVRADLTAALSRTHSWIELTAAPPDATVLRNGTPWPAPRDGWVAEGFSELRVSAPAYAIQSRRWEHPLPTGLTPDAGARYALTIALDLLPTTGTLVLLGEPTGAEVELAGARLCRLPCRVALPPGRHDLRVHAQGTTERRLEVDIQAGGTTPAEMVLDAELVAEPLPPETDVLPWTFTGTGIGLAAVGAGLLVWSSTIEGDIADLNANPTLAGDFQDYQARYRDLGDRQDGAWASGWSLLGVGVSSILTGTVLWLTSDE